MGALWVQMERPSAARSMAELGPCPDGSQETGTSPPPLHTNCILLPPGTGRAVQHGKGLIWGENRAGCISQDEEKEGARALLGWPPRKEPGRATPSRPVWIPALPHFHLPTPAGMACPCSSYLWFCRSWHSHCSSSDSTHTGHHTGTFSGCQSPCHSGPHRTLEVEGELVSWAFGKPGPFVGKG